MDYRLRQRVLNTAARHRHLSGVLVSHLPNVRYLCGFTGSAALLLLKPSGNVFFTDGRYTEQARAEVRGARVVICKGPLLSEAVLWARRLRLRNLGFEAAHTTVEAREVLRRQLGRGIRLLPLTGLVEHARMVKDADEVRQMRVAANLGSALLPVALKKIRPGVAEVEVAAALEFAARTRGAEGMSFPTIVLAGKRTALPHGHASLARIPRDGFVLLDFGVILNGYCSDMTRTLHVGRPTNWARNTYAAVREAQLAALDTVRAGVSVGDVDRAARQVLRQARLDRYFTHSTGHGVGLEIHEAPRIARAQAELLQPGMVITIEPGVYVPGRGGVRIEDTVVVTPRGCRVLTSPTKELLEL